MPKSGPSIQHGRRSACRGQLLLLMPIARDAHGRFTRWFTGMPLQLLAFRRDARGRFACLAPVR
ncbi:hypothetical protein GCM10010399_17090 [Dactylosporangium fulvum]|uniref:Uncharacterized protein n=1 Tax=Dactylosporangium fulvum TaxID=53359 RepID=A0ABY5W140_9ACTN|nr:hypothetical protein [Dactylosporangium fulvum]UWP82769.1 hypothetical protein Dfulv_00100 [Dactylosporangium fulvum]